MNLHKTLASGLLAVCLITTGLPAPINAAVKEQVEGTISLYYGDGKLQCVFPASNGFHKFPKEPPAASPTKCASFVNGNGFIELNNVPSASKIYLINGKGLFDTQPGETKSCGILGAVAFGYWELRTIKDPTTTTEVNFGDIRTHNNGDVVKPGLRLIEHKVFSTPPSNPNEINCLWIEISS